MPPVLRPRKEALSASKPVLSTPRHSRKDRGPINAQMKVASARQFKSEQKKPICLSSDDNERTPQQKKVQGGYLTGRCRQNRAFTIKVSSSSEDDENKVSPGDVNSKPGSKAILSEEKYLIEGMLSNEAESMSGVLDDETYQANETDKNFWNQNKLFSSAEKDAKGLRDIDEKIVSRKLFEDELQRTVEGGGNVGFIVEGVTSDVFGAPGDIVSEGNGCRKFQYISDIDKAPENVEEDGSGGRKRRGRGKQFLDNEFNIGNASEENCRMLDVDKGAQRREEGKTIMDERIAKIIESEMLPCDTPQSLEGKEISRSSHNNRRVLKGNDDKLRVGGSKWIQIGKDDFPFSKESKDRLGKESLEKSQDNCSEGHPSQQDALKVSLSREDTVENYEVAENLSSQEGTKTVETNEEPTEKPQRIQEQTDYFCISEADTHVKEKILPTFEEDETREEATCRKDLSTEEDVAVSCDKGESGNVEESDMNCYKRDDKCISPKRKRDAEIREGEVHYRAFPLKSNGKKRVKENDLASFSNSIESSCCKERQVKTPYKIVERKDRDLQDMSINEMHVNNESDIETIGREDDKIHTGRKTEEFPDLYFYGHEQRNDDKDGIQDKSDMRHSRESISPGTKCKIPKREVKRSEAEGIAKLNLGENTDSVKKLHQPGLCQNDISFLSIETCSIGSQKEGKEGTRIDLTYVELNQEGKNTRHEKEKGDKTRYEKEKGDKTGIGGFPGKSEQTPWLEQKESRSYKKQEDKDENEDEEGEDDEEMADVFLKALRGYLSPASNLLSKEGKRDTSAMTSSGNKISTKATRSNIPDPFSRRDSELVPLGRKTSCTSETMLSSDLKKSKSNTQVDIGTIWQKDRHLQDGHLLPPKDPRMLNKLVRKQAKDTAGEKWFDLPAQTITPELKRELQVLKLRRVLDPKRHYKAEDSKTLPKYFQVGTVVEGPADFYSGRLAKKERKGTLADELLFDSNLQAYRKRKYLEIQDKKQAGGKKFWKQKKLRHKPSWAKV